MWFSTSQNWWSQKEWWPWMLCSFPESSKCPGKRTTPDLWDKCNLEKDERKKHTCRLKVWCRLKVSWIYFFYIKKKKKKEEKEEEEERNDCILWEKRRRKELQVERTLKTPTHAHTRTRTHARMCIQTHTHTHTHTWTWRLKAPGIKSGHAGWRYLTNR